MAVGCAFAIDLNVHFPRLQPIHLGGVRSKVPAIVPLVPGGVASGDLVSVRSRMRSRRAPLATPKPNLRGRWRRRHLLESPVNRKLFPAERSQTPHQCRQQPLAGVPHLHPAGPTAAAGASRTYVLVSTLRLQMGSAASRLAPSAKTARHHHGLFPQCHMHSVDFIRKVGQSIVPSMPSVKGKI